MQEEYYVILRLSGETIYSKLRISKFFLRTLNLRNHLFPKIISKHSQGDRLDFFFFIINILVNKFI